MTAILVPESAVALVVEDVVRYGRHGLETGAFLLAKPDDPDRIRAVALLGAIGIDRRCDRLVISGIVLARLFDWADEAGLVVRAQIHSHRYEAVMSPTDERFGLTVEGFTGAIVPDSAAPSRNAAVWGWWRFENGRWVPTDHAETTTAGTVRVVRVDEGGVDG